ncbi:response regulator transcription factor [Sporomusa acidovorans]|uniref:Alkaline phosphatase synthesis transcriptional regulatory protein PhoP n=1 Tax=Sporomusa acidovorans (strain ATCC 49682 / DSM 3132 / Mol) TaxID=1123286 RepID=A0ABZ3IX90_SPOA4|nr:response regulator transcription factor [Sporomusa acidovorans]OZC23697.1 alkaline phosphatase synthesis transcriptional regulatory protein PhoP [Sporomusa acidovorans DSM 3132]SDE25521.1 Transcriptional regulatory protein, C terminal [Sporomusa acidovorans]
MQQIKILVADDEPNITEVLQLYLEQEGFTVYTASNGQEALAIEEEQRPDLLILDVMLPKCSGWDICSTVERPVPVIFLTAKSAESDKLLGFSLGADDYITKPFSPREVMARVKAVLRRSGVLIDSSLRLEFPELSIDQAAQAVYTHGQNAQLSPKEYELLVFMARHAKLAFSRDQLLTNVWGYDFDGADRTVDATVKRLRQKIDNPEYTYIHTIWGIGYKFEVSAR